KLALSNGNAWFRLTRVKGMSRSLKLPGSISAACTSHPRSFRNAQKTPSPAGTSRILTGGLLPTTRCSVSCDVSTPMILRSAGESGSGRAAASFVVACMGDGSPLVVPGETSGLDSLKERAFRVLLARAAAGYGFQCRSDIAGAERLQSIPQRFYIVARGVAPLGGSYGVEMNDVAVHQQDKIVPGTGRK